MLQTSPSPADRYADRLETGVGRRAVAIGATLLIEAVLLLLLLSLGRGEGPGGGEEAFTVVDFAAGNTETAPEPVEPDEREPEPAPVEPRLDTAEPAPQPPVPAPPQPQAEPTPPPAAIIPVTRDQMARLDITPRRPAAPPAQGPAYGPANTRPSASLDSERVGTAPNGEPLYAARWYREPTDGELRGYLSTASGPGWGLIACRTAPDYRVEDCVALDEYPQGSMMNRAILAAAWQFKVRPPRLGGRDMVGEWVRIRIDYTITRR